LKRKGWGKKITTKPIFHPQFLAGQTEGVTPSEGGSI